MPSNIIRINCAKELTWVVPDSKMEQVIKLLNRVGDKEIISDTASSPCLQIDCPA